MAISPRWACPIVPVRSNTVFRTICPVTALSLRIIEFPKYSIILNTEGPERIHANLQAWKGFNCREKTKERCVAHHMARNGSVLSNATINGVTAAYDGRKGLIIFYTDGPRRFYTCSQLEPMPANWHRTYVPEKGNDVFCANLKSWEKFLDKKGTQ